MINPAIPRDENERAAALRNLNILDTPREESYDEITRLACDEFGVAMSMITLIDTDRQWFKSSVGLGARETVRAMSFCAHTILQQGCFVVRDTLADERFSNHPSVTGDTNFRFYAGCPVHDVTGYRIGALCIVHTESRNFDCTDVAKLAALTRVVENRIALEYSN